MALVALLDTRVAVWCWKIHRPLSCCVPCKMHLPLKRESGVVEYRQILLLWVIAS